MRACLDTAVAVGRSGRPVAAAHGLAPAGAAEEIMLPLERPGRYRIRLMLLDRQAPGVRLARTGPPLRVPAAS